MGSLSQYNITEGAVGWENGSDGKGLVLQAQGPECNPSTHIKFWVCIMYL